MSTQREPAAAGAWSNADERAAAATHEGADLQCDACSGVYAEKVASERLEEVLEATQGLCQDCGCCHWLTDVSARAPAEVVLRPGEAQTWEAVVVYEDGTREAVAAHASFGAVFGALQSWMEHGLEPEAEPEALGL